MPRTPLGQIDGNRQRGFELSSALRNRICGARDGGHALGQIAQMYEIPKETVQYTLKQEPERQHQDSLPRTGRPTKLSKQLKRKILSFVREKPKAEYVQVRTYIDNQVSSSTIYRFLKSKGITNWICKKRPFLSVEVVKKRRKWCSDRLEWDDEWRNIIFSDECSLERGAGAKRAWCFRTPGQKWDKDMIQTHKKGKDLSVMIWGAIWLGGRSDIIFMERDMTAKKEGYTQKSYLKVLEEAIPTIYQPGMIFMQDNAPIHTATRVIQWFQDHAVLLLPWPPYSPDLNPIEHLWAYLKSYINEQYPELNDMGKSNEDYEALCNAIEEAWNAIDQEVIDNLIRSMPRRTFAIWKAKGWHSKY
jgi:transposase